MDELVKVELTRGQWDLVLECLNNGVAEIRKMNSNHLAIMREQDKVAKSIGEIYKEINLVVYPGSED